MAAGVISQTNIVKKTLGHNFHKKTLNCHNIKSWPGADVLSSLTFG